MYKQILTKKAVLTGFLLGGTLLLAGCSDSDSDSPAMVIADENVVSFAISADAGQEIPANASTGSATGTFTLDKTTGALSGSVMVVGTEATAAHIHEAVAGSNGDVVLMLDVADATVSVPDGTLITADQMQSMLAGEYYLNIHSTATLSGELRDQLTAPGIEVIQVSLSGDNEVPAVESLGSGTGYVTLNTETGAMQVRVITTGITTPTVAHVHTGVAGATGAPLFALTQDTAEVGNYAGSVESLEATALTTVLDGGTYLNVHSEENEGGELRGQIVLP